MYADSVCLRLWDHWLSLYQENKGHTAHSELMKAGLPPAAIHSTHSIGFGAKDQSLCERPTLHKSGRRFQKTARAKMKPHEANLASKIARNLCTEDRPSFLLTHNLYLTLAA